jgi:predicted flap endonuclease-1-like 5' DNA nuclease
MEPSMHTRATLPLVSSPSLAAPSRAPAPGTTTPLLALAGRSLPGTAVRPPKAPPPRKAASAAECERLEQLPNIGPALAADLRLVGVSHPQALASADPLALYRALERASGRRQDPCVLDTFMAACDFMRGGPARPWWSFTAERKRLHGVV